MHIGSHGSGDLTPFYPKIEATFWAHQRHVQSQSREGKQFQEVNMDPTTTTLREFAMPYPNSIPSNVMRPLIEANNFQFNPRLTTLF